MQEGKSRGKRNPNRGVLGLIPPVHVGNSYPSWRCQFFILFICFLPWAGGGSVKMPLQALRHLNKNLCNAAQLT